MRDSSQQTRQASPKSQQQKKQCPHWHAGGVKKTFSGPSISRPSMSMWQRSDSKVPALKVSRLRTKSMKSWWFATRSTANFFSSFSILALISVKVVPFLGGSTCRSHGANHREALAPESHEEWPVAGAKGRGQRARSPH